MTVHWDGREVVERGAGWRPVLALGGRVVVPSRAVYRFRGTDGDPDALLRFELRKGAVECVKVEVTRSTGGRAVRPSDFELLKGIGTLGVDVFCRLALVMVDGPDLSTGETHFEDMGAQRHAELRRQLERGLVTGRQDRHRPPADEELEDVARIFAATGRIADVVAERGYTRRTAYRRVEQARERGFLDAEGALVSSPPPPATAASAEDAEWSGYDLVPDPGDPAYNARRRAQHEALADQLVPGRRATKGGR